MWNKASFRILSFLALAVLLGIVFLVPKTEAANHREAPITALDRTADITDWFAFRSYEPGRENTLTMILGVDPLLEPSNGPNYFPFDPEIAYRLIVDNNRDAVDDIIYEFRFFTEIRLPGVFTGFVGNLNFGPIPPITELFGDGDAGINLRQTYTVAVLNGDGSVACAPISVDTNENPLIAVPSNVGPKTMPNYEDLAGQGIFTVELCDGTQIRVFAGTVDDPFYIDLGGTFDSLNTPVVVLQGQDDADGIIVGAARDDVSGFNVNIIALEVPIDAVTLGEGIPPADSPNAVIGTYGATFRPTFRTFGQPIPPDAELVQIQRMGNPLINELIIGTGSKDLFSMSEPQDDAQFADFFLPQPLAATLLNTEFGVNIPPGPRNDLLPLVLYIPPICAGCNPAGEGPIADLLRLNVAFTTDPLNRSRLGALAGDFGGHPNGRRVFDDVTDIFLRVGAGVLNPDFNVAPNNQLGDGVNRNDFPVNGNGGGGNSQTSTAVTRQQNLNDLGYQDIFPYVAFAQDGRDSRHVDRFEPLTLGGDENGGNGGGCAIADAGTGNMSNLASTFGTFLIPVLFVFVRRFINKNNKN
ncbi:MAG TPA: DUF4331 domain-containing protein [Thermodesulfobacteriota bacterium]|nr:DUF4331 domain-containing protein [Thermodesulfobacteriota bacterium]